MASPRPKSPRPPVAARKDEKEESFWEKIGTLGRKKRIKEGMYTLLFLVLRNRKVTLVVYSVIFSILDIFT
jgi:hypothetical protein